MIKNNQFKAEELERLRHFQRWSYDIGDSTATDLRVGISAMEVAQKMRKAFHIAGAHNCFHVPVALFGERSAYPQRPQGPDSGIFFQASNGEVIFAGFGVLNAGLSRFHQSVFFA